MTMMRDEYRSYTNTKMKQIVGTPHFTHEADLDKLRSIAQDCTKLAYLVNHITNMMRVSWVRTNMGQREEKIATVQSNQTNVLETIEIDDDELDLLFSSLDDAETAAAASAASASDPPLIETDAFCCSTKQLLKQPTSTALFAPISCAGNFYDSPKGLDEQLHMGSPLVDFYADEPMSIEVFDTKRLKKLKLSSGCTKSLAP